MALFARLVASALAVLLFPCSALSSVVEYDLAVSRRQLEIDGVPADAMAVNGSVPGPVLRFTEGDYAKIRVRNETDEETSIHWHGILVPPDMDGVPRVSFPSIVPGETFTYEFPIRQSGTYWYHSHSNLQEQSGVYGAIVIDEREGQSAASGQVLLFSDWSSENPHDILRTLKTGNGEWYSLEKGVAQSLAGAALTGNLGNYFRRELSRMPPMDIADVAYDRFLVNGAPEQVVNAKAGERTLLRIINGSATTYFYLEFAGGPMTIVAADGQAVEPLALSRLLVGVAETYDVLVDVPADGSWEFRATSYDSSGFASAWLGEGSRRYAPDVPYPDLYGAMAHSGGSYFSLAPAGVMGMGDEEVEAGRFDSPGMAMGGMDHGAGAHPEPAFDPEFFKDFGRGEVGESSGAVYRPRPRQAERGGRRFSDDFGLMAQDVSSRGALAADGMSADRPWPPYDRLKSVRKTSFPEGKPVREVRLTLDGDDMKRYVWLINDRTASEAEPIVVRGGEVVRFILINRTMMHHPMHLHGHFFRVVNPQGDYSPLKHTVDVAPMSTTVIEFYAGETGDWLFHCHLLYHMEAGMMSLIHYDGFDPGEAVRQYGGRFHEEHWYAWGEAALLSNMSVGYLTASNTRNIFTLEWEAGWGRADETGWEAVAVYERYFNRFFTLLAGGYAEGADGDPEKSRGIAGFTYLLPLNLKTRLWIDTDADLRVAVEKEVELFPGVHIKAGASYDTEEKWEGHADLGYILAKRLSLQASWHSVYGPGAGVEFRF